MRFEPNPQGIEEAGRQAVRDWAAGAQSILDHAHRSHTGGDQAEIKNAIRRMAGKRSIEVGEEFLQEWAVEIAAGRRVVLRPG